MHCPICERIERIRKGQNPYFVAELRESYAVLEDDQLYEGYCILLLKSHEEHLDQLPAHRQLALFEDVIEIARAINRSFHPVRLNYECLGNTVAHIHWHVIPRYKWDPLPNMPIWVRPRDERKKSVKPEKLDQLVKTIREELNK